MKLDVDAPAVWVYGGVTMWKPHVASEERMMKVCRVDEVRMKLYGSKAYTEVEAAVLAKGAYGAPSQQQIPVRAK